NGTCRQSLKLKAAVVPAVGRNSTIKRYWIVTNAVNATLYKNLKFNIVHDIAPVVATFRSPNVLVVTPTLPAKTLPEFGLHSYMQYSRDCGDGATDTHHSHHFCNGWRSCWQRLR